jgi:putative restriction endonuclease
MQGKGYDLADSSVSPSFEELLQMLLGVTVELDLPETRHRPGPVFGDPWLAP